MQTKGRVKHKVEGNVQEIKKQERALNIDSVGEKKNNFFTENKPELEKTGLFNKLMGLFSKEKR